MASPRMRLPVLLLVCELCIAACSSGPRRLLDEAESLLASRPDSALNSLQHVPEEVLSTKSLKARHALLISMAQIKNHLSTTEDSTVRIAYDYYRRHGHDEDRMKSAYYLGVVKENAGETAEAAFLFNEAGELAERLNNHHYLGLANQHLCSLYANNFDNRAAYAHAQTAVKAFDNAEELLSADFSRMDVARQSYNLGNRRQAVELVDSLLECNKDSDLGLRYTLLVLRADIHYGDQVFERAREYYEQAMSLGYPLGLPGIGNMAIINEKMGRHMAADSCLNAIYDQMTTPLDSTVYFASAQTVQKLRGDYRNALNSSEESIKLQNKVVLSELSRSLTHIQKAYFEERYITKKAQNKNLFLLLALISTLLTAIVILTTLALRRRKRQIIEEMEEIEDLTRDLSLLQEKQKGTGAIISSLVQDKIRVMQRLTDTYFSWSDEAVSLREAQYGRVMKEDIIANFRSELRSLRNDENFIPAIEKTLDHNYQGLVSRLRTTCDGSSDHPLKELDFQILTLLFAGFTPKSIGFIMDMTHESVRTRKTRYKKLFLSMGDAGFDFAGHLA